MWRNCAFGCGWTLVCGPSLKENLAADCDFKLSSSKTGTGTADYNLEQ